MNQSAPNLLLTITAEGAPGRVLLSLQDLATSRVLIEADSYRPSDPAFEQALALLQRFPEIEIDPAQQRAIGLGLSEWLLPPPIRQSLYGIMRSAPLDRVRLWLATEDSDLEAIPWEASFLSDAPGHPQGEYLALHERISVIRRSSTGIKSITRTVDGLRVLIVWADPGSNSPIKHDPSRPRCPYSALPFIAEEVAGITAVLKRRDIHYEEIRHATPFDIQKAFEQSWHIVHFIGHAVNHATGGHIVLQGAEAGSWVEKSSDYLVPLFASKGVQLVVLSACRTAAPMVGVANGLVRGIPAVVATQLPFSDRCAAAFSSELYRRLAVGEPIDSATDGARRSIRHHGADWIAPVLLLSTPDPELFQTRRTLPAATVAAPVPIPAGALFIGRDGELMQIREAITERPVLLAGMGGVGKSMLAAEHAHRNREVYPGGIYWFDASSTETLESSLARSIPTSNQLDITRRDRAEQALRTLGQLELPCLVVFDNLDAHTDSSLLRPGGHCRVLATSRARNLLRNAHLILLEEFDTETSLDLLQDRLAGKAQDDFRKGRRLEAADTVLSDEELALVREVASARTLAGLVGCIPLALDIIAHHVQHLERQFSSYLQDRMRGPDEIIPELERAFRHWTESTRHPASVYTTLYTQYAELDNCARETLCMAGCLAGTDFSLDLLLLSADDESSKRDTEDAAATLKNLSLLTGGQDRRLRMHDLLRFFVQSLPTTERPTDSDSAVIRSLTRQVQNGHKEGKYTSVRADLAHYEHIARVFDSQSGPPGLARLLLEYGRYRALNGERKAGIALMERALTLQPRAEDDPGLLLDILASLAECCQDASSDRPDEIAESAHYKARALESADQIRSILEVERKAPAVSRAHAYRSAGYVYRRGRHFDVAQALYERGLAIAKAEGSLPEAAEFLNNLAILSEVAGDPGRAVILLTEAIELERAAPEGHPQIAVCLNNLGRNLRRIGMYQGSLGCHEEAIKINLGAYSELHPYVAASRYFAGRALEKLNRNAEALALYIAAHQVYLEARGPSGRMTKMVSRRLRALALKSARKQKDQ